MAEVVIIGESGKKQVDKYGNTTATYDLEYSVKLASYRGGANAALNAVDSKDGTRIPRKGEPYRFGDDSDSTATCQEVNATRISQTDDGGALYTVTARFGSFGAETEEKEPSEDDPFTFDASYAQQSIALEVDLDGCRVANAVGEPYNPSPERTLDVVRFTLKRTEARNPLRHMVGFQSFVNATEFWTFPPRTLKMLICPSWDGRKWNVTYNIEFNPLGYRPAILERGFHYYESEEGETEGAATETPENGTQPSGATTETDSTDSTSGETESTEGVEEGKPKRRLVRALGKDGEPVDEPVLLAADGTKLPDDAKPVFTSYRVYEEIDFAIFRLPNLQNS